MTLSAVDGEKRKQWSKLNEGMILSTRQQDIT